MRIDNVVKTDVLHSDIDKIENDLLFHDYTCDIKFPHLHVRLISILKKKNRVAMTIARAHHHQKKNNSWPCQKIAKC